MRFFTFSMVSAMFVGLAACNGGGAEDCSDNADNDGDAAVDCDDSECATDAACDDTNDTTDTTDTNDGPEVCDDEAGDDEDGDGDANCADDECAGISTNCDEVIAPVEAGDATITSTTWTGTGSQGWNVYPLTLTGFDAPDKVMCEISFDSTGTVHGAAADCDGCDFAFDVTFDNTGTPTGEDCTNFEPPFGANVDGNAYGYGYNPAYVYGTYDPAPSLMYYSTTDSAWVGTGATVSLTGDNFKYALPVGSLYYY